MQELQKRTASVVTPAAAPALDVRQTSSTLQGSSATPPATWFLPPVFSAHLFSALPAPSQFDPALGPVPLPSFISCGSAFHAFPFTGLAGFTSTMSAASPTCITAASSPLLSIQKTGITFHVVATTNAHGLHGYGTIHSIFSFNLRSRPFPSALPPFALLSSSFLRSSLHLPLYFSRQKCTVPLAQ